jgi:hypothetical protein
MIENVSLIVKAFVHILSLVQLVPNKRMNSQAASSLYLFLSSFSSLFLSYSSIGFPFSMLYNSWCAQIGRYCPRLLAHFSAGCMSNVTRSVLKEYSSNCTALKADWGPFFQFADDDGGTVPGYPNYS